MGQVHSIQMLTSNHFRVSFKPIISRQAEYSLALARIPCTLQLIKPTHTNSDYSKDPLSYQQLQETLLVIIWISRIILNLPLLPLLVLSLAMTWIDCPIMLASLHREEPVGTWWFTVSEMGLQMWPVMEVVTAFKQLKQDLAIKMDHLLYSQITSIWVLSLKRFQLYKMAQLSKSTTNRCIRTMEVHHKTLRTTRKLILS